MDSDYFILIQNYPRYLFQQQTSSPGQIKEYLQEIAYIYFYLSLNIYFRNISIVYLMLGPVFTYSLHFLYDFSSLIVHKYNGCLYIYI